MKVSKANEESRKHFSNAFQDQIMSLARMFRIHYIQCLRVSLSIEEAGIKSGWPMPMPELWSGGMYAIVRFLYHELHANNVAVALVYLLKFPLFKESY
jgi:hypothetical protein